MAKRMTRQALRQALTDGEEVALLDVRERGRYSAGHLFLAVNTPLSQLELVMRSRVPRSSARVIVCDDLEGLADPAARVMEEAGYSDVSVLDASMEDCTRAGFQVFQGHYATTYALGLHAAERYGVPQIDAESLKSKLDAGEDLIVVDTRTQGEYNRGCVPSAISAPLVELIYRIRDLAPDPETQVVVNCGAVTRGVLGCQSLIEAGIENPVSVLTNGARGWHIAGFALETGAERTYPAVSDNAKSLVGGGAKADLRWRFGDLRDPGPSSRRGGSSAPSGLCTWSTCAPSKNIKPGTSKIRFGSRAGN